MNIQSFKKFFKTVCVILLGVYTILLLDSMARHEKPVTVTSNLHTKITTRNLNYTLTMPSSNYLDFSEELKQRRATINKICTRKSLNAPRQVQNSMYKNALFKLYVDQKHNLAWCPVFKAASSTILKLFASLGGLLTKDIELKLQKQQIQIDKLTRKAFPPLKGKDDAKVVEVSNRLLVVRHPFARLLSAYRDKLEHRENREFYYQKFGKRIVQTFGNPKTQVEPTFVDFLKSIVKKWAFDEHWRPYYIHCAPCMLDYDIVLKTEFLGEELKHVLNSLHLEDHFPNTMHINPNGTTDYQIIEKYYSSVPPELLQDIYQIYELDFELFNYSPHYYFEITRLRNTKDQGHR